MQKILPKLQAGRFAWCWGSSIDSRTAGWDLWYSRLGKLGWVGYRVKWRRGSFVWRCYITYWRSMWFGHLRSHFYVFYDLCKFIVVLMFIFLFVLDLCVFCIVFSIVCLNEYYLCPVLSMCSAKFDLSTGGWWQITHHKIQWPYKSICTHRFFPGATAE